MFCGSNSLHALLLTSEAVHKAAISIIELVVEVKVFHTPSSIFDDLPTTSMSLCPMLMTTPFLPCIVKNMGLTVELCVAYSDSIP